MSASLGSSESIRGGSARRTASRKARLPGGRILAVELQRLALAPSMAARPGTMGLGGIQRLEAEVDPDRFDVAPSGSVDQVAWERLLSRGGGDYRVALRPVGEWYRPQRGPHARQLGDARFAGRGEVASPIDRTIRMAHVLMPIDVQEPNQHRPLPTAAPAAHRQ